MSDPARKPADGLKSPLEADLLLLLGQFVPQLIPFGEVTNERYELDPCSPRNLLDRQFDGELGAICANREGLHLDSDDVSDAGIEISLQPGVVIVSKTFGDDEFGDFFPDCIFCLEAINGFRSRVEDFDDPGGACHDDRITGHTDASLELLVDLFKCEILLDLGISRGHELEGGPGHEAGNDDTQARTEENRKNQIEGHHGRAVLAALRFGQKLCG